MEISTSGQQERKIVNISFRLSGFFCLTEHWRALISEFPELLNINLLERKKMRKVLILAKLKANRFFAGLLSVVFSCLMVPTSMAQVAPPGLSLPYKAEYVGNPTQVTDAFTIGSYSNGRAGAFIALNPRDAINPNDAFLALSYGTGRAGLFQANHPTSTNPALSAITSGAGPAILGKGVIAGEFTGRVYVNSPGPGPNDALTVLGSIKVDQGNQNNGTVALGAMKFGTGKTSEGIASKRSAGGNQNGLDLYTRDTPRLSVTNGGWVGIGTTTPTRPLEVVGTILATDIDASRNVSVGGFLTKMGGRFRIDHPLDPLNKTLSHSFVESPDMKNIYDGVVTLDSQGEAVVALPDWFEALNKDFRYQLTCIGGSALVYISEEINNNRFSIAGGKQGLKVSWQVTGIRMDPYANANRVRVEEEKSSNEKGHHLYPDAYVTGEHSEHH
jgi:hypothetical protein